MDHILNHVFISFIRNDGNAHLLMCAIFVGNIANIVLDYVFMYPFDMRIFASVLATGLAPILGILTSSIYYWTKQFHFHLDRFHIPLIPKITSLGFTAFINEFSSGIVILVFNILILKVARNEGVVAYGIVANYALIILAVFTGISQGVQPLISSAYGLKEYSYTKRLYHSAVLVSATERARLSSFISVTRGLSGIIIMTLLFKLDGIWLAFSVTEGVTAMMVFFFIRHYPIIDK